MKHIHTLTARICAFAVLLSMATATARAEGTWTLFPSFDIGAYRIFDTPTQTHMLAWAQKYKAKVPENSKKLSFLYTYDRETEEMRQRHYGTDLNGHLITLAEYNPKGKYLLAVYDDSNIDLIYDSGEVVNVPALLMADNVTDATVNSITFDPESHHAYLATGFGYVVIDDVRHEVAESRIYDRGLLSVARVGDEILAVTSDNVVGRAPKSSPRLDFTDYATFETPTPAVLILPLEGRKCGIIGTKGGYSALMTADLSGDVPVIKNIRAVSGYSMQYNRDGYFIGSGDEVLQLHSDGTVVRGKREEADTGAVSASYDFKTFLFSPENKGFYARKGEIVSASDSRWEAPSGEYRPEAPAPFLVTNIAWHPQRGFLVSNHGRDHNFTSSSLHNTLQLSGYLNGSWTQYGLKNVNPAQIPAISNPDGLALAPENPDILYFGSVLHGMLRINLADPRDVLHLARRDASWEELPGFKEVQATNPQWPELSHFSPPQFDAMGNLWTVTSNYNGTPGGYINVWPSDLRTASASPSSYRPMIQYPIHDAVGPMALVAPLKSGSNRGLAVCFDGMSNGTIYVYNHAYTLETTSDDSKGTISLAGLRDDDGESVDALFVRALHEDPQSGLVWAGTDNGVFAFNPRSVLGGKKTVTRFKISRNDGTSLADYLLNGVPVNHITNDTRNRKWISTDGAGLVCVSADGRAVVSELTTETSGIPDNTVYASAYSPQTGTIMTGTAKGLAEYRPYTRGDGASLSEVRAYPNPVRPDYLGLVTIDGLSDNAIVKIADSKGRVVRELGFAPHGEVTWDVTDLTHRRVQSGVYYILASSGPDDDSMAEVTKILVVN